MKKIIIPEPCHESWADMSPSDKGRHCQSCDKVVVDFSASSQEEILAYLDSSSGKTCGRFRKDQLADPKEQIPAEPTLMYLPRRSASPLAFAMPYFKSIAASVLALVGAQTAMAQGEVSKGKIVRSHHHILEQNRNHFKVHLAGQVFDKKGSPVANARVVLYNLGNILSSTMTDEQGGFEFEIEKGEAMEQSVRLKVSASGFEKKEMKDIKLEKKKIKLKCNLKAIDVAPDVSLVQGGFISLADLPEKIEMPLDGLPTEEVTRKWKEDAEWDKQPTINAAPRSDSESSMCSESGEERDWDLHLMGDTIYLDQPNAVPDTIIPEIEFFEMGDVEYVMGEEPEVIETVQESEPRGLVPEVEPVEPMMTMGLPALEYPDIKSLEPIDVKLPQLQESSLESEPTSPEPKIIEEQLGFTIFPNPTQDFITIRPEWSERFLLTVRDINGKIVFDKSMSEGEERIDVSQLESGTYIVQINLASGTVRSAPFIKH